MWECLHYGTLECVPNKKMIFKMKNYEGPYAKLCKSRNKRRTVNILKDKASIET